MRLPKRLSGPVVLAIASAMFSVGVLAILKRAPPTGAGASSSPPVALETATAAETAETFLDAWRKRDHVVARSLSAGEARRRVEERNRQDESLTSEERDVKTQVWDAMAQTRLSLQVDESRLLENGTTLLRTRAVGEFLGRPYERRIVFGLSSEENRWRVVRMNLGEQLQEAPGFLERSDSPARETPTEEAAP